METPVQHPAATPASVPPSAATARRVRPSAWTWFLGISLLLAAILRFSFPQDIEYKGDERFMMSLLEQYRQTHVLPVIGMRSSTGVPNPAPSVWMFLLLGQLFHANTPVELARSVAALNVLALAILFVMARVVVPRAEREVWSWTAALFSVNVFAVLFGRKIWAQSVAPFFAVLLLLVWFRRDRRLSGFFAGVFMALLGQIHMAGFFFAGALLLWSALFERFRRAPTRVAWRWLTAGLVAGSLPLLPWLPYVQGHSQIVGSAGWSGLLPTKYWYEWIRTSLGFGLDYSLGPVALRDFLRGPLLAGHPTFGVLALQVVTAGMIARLLSLLLRSRRISLRPLLGSGSETAFLESAALWGTGLLLTFASIPLYTHYLLVMYPLPWIWMARLGTAAGRKGRVGLGVIWGAQLLVSIAFLLYIHAHHGAVHGDYGIGYGYQRK